MDNSNNENNLSFTDFEKALDPCCQKELESNRRQAAIERKLREHDVVAMQERRRRHLVTVPHQFEGCRCTYDPNCDGGEYRALINLREKRQLLEKNTIMTTTTESERHPILFHTEEKKDESIGTNDDNDNSSDDDSEYDYLLDDTDLPGQNNELKLLEDRRRAELQYEIYKLEVATQHGFGVVRQMHPARILRAAGLAPGTREPPYAVVIHLVDADSIASASLDLHLEHLAPREGKGTKFMRSGGRTVLSFDAELASKVLPKLNMDKDIPALIAVREGIVVNICRGLREFTGTSSRGDTNEEEVLPNVVTDWLQRCGVLIDRCPDLDEVCRIRPEEEALMEYMVNQKPTVAEPVERYDCGISDCNKSYFHEHVGTSNSVQSGLVVPEEEILEPVEKE